MSYYPASGKRELSFSIAGQQAVTYADTIAGGQVNRWKLIAKIPLGVVVKAFSVPIENAVGFWAYKAVFGTTNQSAMFGITLDDVNRNIGDIDIENANNPPPANFANPATWFLSLPGPWPNPISDSSPNELPGVGANGPLTVGNPLYCYLWLGMHLTGVAPQTCTVTLGPLQFRAIFITADD
jgi:hypothetical protein